MGELVAGPGGGSFPSPTLTTLLFMFLDGGFNPFDSVVLAVQTYAAAVYQAVGDQGID